MCAEKEWCDTEHTWHNVGRRSTPSHQWHGSHRSSGGPGLYPPIFSCYTTWARIFKLLRSLGIDSKEFYSASLCSLAGRYDNPVSTLLLAHIDCLKIPVKYIQGYENSHENLCFRKIKMFVRRILQHFIHSDLSSTFLLRNFNLYYSPHITATSQNRYLRCLPLLFLSVRYF